VAGVDDSAEALAAARYTGAAAAMGGAELVLVHALPPPANGFGTYRIRSSGRCRGSQGPSPVRRTRA
jgi:hypothetical protein